MPKSFELHFFPARHGYELTETVFTLGNGETLRCIRGKTSGAFEGYGSFQWTSAVRAISALAIRHRLSPTNKEVRRQIIGDHDSLASSLGYALSKGPTWLQDMFGCFAAGQLVARRMLLVTNPNKKRPGPVALSINDAFLRSDEILIFFDGSPTDDVETLKQLLADAENYPETLTTDASKPRGVTKNGAMRMAS